MRSSVLSFIAIIALSAAILAEEPTLQVVTKRVPHGGIQPQVVAESNGGVHLIYYKGDAAAGDIFYCSSPTSESGWSEPRRVNSEPSSAIAMGTIRGAHLALGRDGRVHVSWNGSGKATPKGIANPALSAESPYRFSSPMLYSRLERNAEQFEAQRNLMTHTFSLDGGGSVAADSMGNVYVVWHANSQNAEVNGESSRAVWVAVSHDDGKSFKAEARANVRDSGACGCCGLRAFTNQSDDLYVLYRTAGQVVNRDMCVLFSNDHGTNFTTTELDRWEVAQCVMSSVAVAEVDDTTVAAWETNNQISYGRIDGVNQFSQPQRFRPELITTPQKHPVLSSNRRGQVLLAWTEGTGWQKGGAVAWQLLDKSGSPLPDSFGRVEGLPAWSFPAVYANRDDSFTILY